MPFTQKLLKNFVEIYPRIAGLATKVQSQHNFICNYPLSLVQTSSKRHALISDNKIKKGNNLCVINESSCLFSTGLVGANMMESNMMIEQMQKLSQNYESMNENFIDRMKIIIQLMANSQTLQSGEMPLHQYSQYVLGSENIGLPKSEINSRFLLDLYTVWERSNKLMFGNLKKELLKRTEEEQFINACDKGKSVIRDAGEGAIKYASPFIEKIDHSFEPNCKIQPMYLPHRKSSFLRVQAIKDIQAGQRPTLNYGNLNNYELLLRYGFVVENSPNKLFMLPLNFEQIIEIFNKNIDWKQKEFAKNNIKLRNYVKILPKGGLTPQDMLMMRILINDSQNPNQKDIHSQKFDQLIYKFISSHAKTFRKHIKINNLKVSTNKHIRILQDQQISILQEFVSIRDQ